MLLLATWKLNLCKITEFRALFRCSGLLFYMFLGNGYFFPGSPCLRMLEVFLAVPSMPKSFETGAVSFFVLT